MSLGRTRLPDYSIGATVLFVAIALPFFVFTRAQHLHRLEAHASLSPTASVAPQASPSPATEVSPSPQPSAQAATLPVTAGGASARPASTPRHGTGGSGPASTPVSTPSNAPVATSPPPDQAPVAAVSVSPTAGSSPLTVTADASGSSDTDQTPIAQIWIDFGDGTRMLANSQHQATHIYTTAGTYSVTATVIDSGQQMSKSPPATVVVS